MFEKKFMGFTRWWRVWSAATLFTNGLEGHSWFPAAQRIWNPNPYLSDSINPDLITTHYWALRVTVILFCMWNTINNLKVPGNILGIDTALRIPSKHWRSSFFIQKTSPFREGSHLSSSLKNFTLFSHTHCLFSCKRHFLLTSLRHLRNTELTPVFIRQSTCTKIKCLVCLEGEIKMLS